MTERASRVDWGVVLDRARTIIGEYKTSVTLRQLFYRLVAARLLSNTTTAYKTLSNRTARARRDGVFPDLVDNGRRIHEPLTFTGPQEAREWVRERYRRDRTEFMDVSVFLGVEKATMVAQLRWWFRGHGLPVLALGGYASQSYVDTIVADVERRGRPAVLLYAGDFDPSGEDIDRDFIARTGCFDQVVRVALTPGQVEEYGLPPAPGKRTDSRAASFTARHGKLVQVELEALNPSALRQLYEQALAPFWDVSAFERSLAQEREDAATLRERNL